jgi:hypothetical protein
MFEHCDNDDGSVAFGVSRVVDTQVPTSELGDDGELPAAATEPATAATLDGETGLGIRSELQAVVKPVAHISAPMAKSALFIGSSALSA